MNFKGILTLTELKDNVSTVKLSSVERIDGVIFGSKSDLGSFTFEGKLDFSKVNLLVSKEQEFVISDNKIEGNTFAVKLTRAEFDSIEKTFTYTFTEQDIKITLDVPVVFATSFEMNKTYYFNIA